MARVTLLLVGGFPPRESSVVGGVVTTCRALLESRAIRGYLVHVIDSTQISNPPPGFFVRAAYAIARLIKFLGKAVRVRPDVVIIFTSSGAGLVEKAVMAWSARLLSIPVIMAPRGGRLLDSAAKSQVVRWIAPLLFGGARKIVCQGAAWQRFAVTHLGVSIDDAPLIPNWTADAEFLRVGAQRVPSPSMSRPCRFVFVGWMEESKGVLDVVRAFLRLAETRHVHLDLIGDGTCMAEARALVAQAGAEGIVDFRGWVPRAAVVALLRGADVFVLPSWEEGLPNSMIEAMAARLALVVSNVGNIPDVVQHEVQGLLVEPRDPQGLLDALRMVVDDGQLRRRMADEAYALASIMFDPERNIMALLAEAEALAVKGTKPPA